jgi:hypothetical protein
MRKSVLLIIIALFIASCNDYLDVSSPSIFDRDYVYKSEPEIATAVNGIYVPIISTWAGTWAKKLNLNTDVEFNSLTNPNSLSASAFVPSTGDRSVFGSIWNGLYNAVNRANDVIEGIEGSGIYKDADKTAPSQLMHYYGEAKVLRAMLYYELVSDFGDVPYRRESSGDKDKLYIGTTDREVILTDMINDLISVEPTMLYASESDRGVEGVSREFCQGLIARIALARAGWTLRPDTANPAAIGTMQRYSDYQKYYKIAEEYAGKVITEGRHTLTRSYAQLWNDECNWIVPVDDDNIFDIPTKVGGTGEMGYSLGVAVVGGRNSQGQSASNAPQGYAAGGDNVALTYMLSFDHKDLRRDQTCVMYRYRNLGTANLQQEIRPSISMQCGKWNRLCMRSPLGATSNNGTGINWCYMRYADILLMYAEAANENNNGPTEAAKTALKQVRRRAFDPADWPEKVEQYVDNLNSKEAFFDAIFKERAWEMGGEKIRRYDLARWNLYSKTIYNMYFDWIRLGKVAMTKWCANTTTPFEEPTTDPRFDDMPAVAYYKYVNVPDPINEICSQTIEYYKEDGINSYLQALPSYPAKTPAGYKNANLCIQYISQVPKTANPRQWVPSSAIQCSFYGFINEGNAATVNPDTDPVRYILPLSPDAISSHQGLLKNYYGY